jgi:hypothetical protein
MPSDKSIIRCAIYTRKSSEEVSNNPSILLRPSARPVRRM